MTMTMTERVLKATLVMVIVMVIISGLAKAQATPEFMVTWKANNYAPPDYPGKILPADGTKVDLALELIDNGQLADLSGTEVRWFVNSKLQKSGLGLKNFSFDVERFRGNPIVDVFLAGYKGNNLNKRIVLPLASPEIAIDLYPNFIKALLYFFNVKNISQVEFTWSANGNQTEGIGDHPDILNLDTKNLPSGTSINLEISARNLLKPAEFATKAINLITR